MADTVCSQLYIAVALLSGASEQIADAAEYLERAGDQPGSQALNTLSGQAREAIGQIEAKIKAAKGACETGPHQW